MKYNIYRYLYPPRPERAAAPNTLSVYETQGWVAQAKLNGTCCTIYVPPVGHAFAMGRHGASNKIVWQPGDQWENFQQHLPGKDWYVFVGELLHSKGIGVRDTIYLHDLLVEDGEYLIGATYQDRCRRLAKLCENVPGEHFVEHTHTVIAPGVWLAQSHAHSFTAWFDAIRDFPATMLVKTSLASALPIEGLVFKNPAAKLLPCGTASANSKWQQKCRRATDHLSF